MADLLGMTDRWGRAIVVTEDGWSHIHAEHAEMQGQEGAVPKRESYHQTGVLPEPYGRRYLKVCVRFAPPDETGAIVGEVVTAYPTPDLTRGETQRWP